MEGGQAEGGADAEADRVGAGCVPGGGHTGVVYEEVHGQDCHGEDGRQSPGIVKREGD